MLEPLSRYEVDIIVATRIMSGKDEFNVPIYTYTEQTVSGCLVHPGEPVDLATGKWESTRQEGHQAKYYLYIPKSCTINFENAKVKVDGQWYKTLGIPMPYPKVPPTSRWNQYVIIERETG